MSGVRPCAGSVIDTGTPEALESIAIQRAIEVRSLCHAPIILVDTRQAAFCTVDEECTTQLPHPDPRRVGEHAKDGASAGIASSIFDLNHDAQSWWWSLARTLCGAAWDWHAHFCVAPARFDVLHHTRWSLTV